MNWENIQEKYLEEFDEFYNLITEQTELIYPSRFIQSQWREMEEINDNSLWGWIENFFDSKGIIIILAYIKNYGDEKGFLYELFNQKGNMIFSSYYKEQKIYKSRQEAREAATIKAFEILERDK